MRENTHTWVSDVVFSHFLERNEGRLLIYSPPMKYVYENCIWFAGRADGKIINGRRTHE